MLLPRGREPLDETDEIPPATRTSLRSRRAGPHEAGQGLPARDAYSSTALGSDGFCSGSISLRAVRSPTNPLVTQLDWLALVGGALRGPRWGRSAH